MVRTILVRVLIIFLTRKIIYFVIYDYSLFVYL
nr:MAG TPA: hypothetical protein [Caudoviricetes sp.]